MKITFKLFATLTDYLPTQDKYVNAVDLEVAPGTTIGQVVEQHRLPERWAHVLLDGDVLAIWPPIAGG